MSAGDPLILVTGASDPVAVALLERTAGQGIRILAVSGRPPSKSWPHVTWFEQDLGYGPADVRAGTLVSLGSLRHALNQVEQAPGIGRVVALSTAGTDYFNLPRSHVERADLRRLAGIEQRLAAACQQRGILLTLLKPCLVYHGGDTGTFSPAASALAGRRFLLLGQGGLRAPVHADDLARLVVRCLEAGQDSAGTCSLAGGESLTVAAMIERVATSRSVFVRRLPVPASLARRTLRGLDLPDAAVSDLSGLYGHDLLPDDARARERLGWQPRGFRP
jgi:nucleoside-diphosphate-sugar epimerase